MGEAVWLTLLTASFSEFRLRSAAKQFERVFRPYLGDVHDDRGHLLVDGFIHVGEAAVSVPELVAEYAHVPGGGELVRLHVLLELRGGKLR